VHPDRQDHRCGRREQRTGRRHHHLGRRAPDHRAGRPPRRPLGPAVVLPGAARPRHRARRSRLHRPADRRGPQHRGIPPAQTDQPVPARTGPHPAQPARSAHPPPAAPARSAIRPGTRRKVGPRPGRRPGHARRQRLQLDLPWMDHRPARPGSKNWIITADAAEMQQLRERRARPAGFYSRARWTQPANGQGTRQ